MGEVQRVRDRVLGRVMAMKFIRTELAADDALRDRFREEAQVTAQLQHPGIVPVHDFGQLSDGRLFYTMKEIRGRTLARVLRERTGGPPRGLVGYLHRACEAVAYAHVRGVVHRDLKPANIMVGAFGEVLVLDWGVTRLLGRGPAARSTPEVTPRRDRTRVGSVVGTPDYMSPEQARGEAVTPRSDVFSLGVILSEVLHHLRTRSDVGDATLSGLDHLAARATEEDPAARFPDAGALAESLGSWLDGRLKREAALREIARADALAPRVESLRAESDRLRAEARSLLRGVAGYAAIEEKQPGWSREERALEREGEAAMVEVEVLQALRGALNRDPDLPEAHARLADHYRRLHQAAEARRDGVSAGRLERLLRDHDRGAHAAYLAGQGALTLLTHPPGVEVHLYRYQARSRRLEPVFVRALGETPLRAEPLPSGSYLLKLRAADRPEVRYPVFIERGACWDGAPPGADALAEVPLPPAGSLGPADVYVPPGWFWCGGDPGVVSTSPRRRVWVDGFAIRRFPVTNREYIEFLHDLVRQGRSADALRCAPRQRSGSGGEPGALIFGYDEGRFSLRPDGEGDPRHPEVPVSNVTWSSARAYCTWLAEREGWPWRLPGELEWEKAARGVDGRFFPWGDHLDPTWCHMHKSHRGRRLPAVVDSYPIDESPYSVRGLGGNFFDWCGENYAFDGPPVVGERAVITPWPRETEPGSLIVVRGGVWHGGAIYARSAGRYGSAFLSSGDNTIRPTRSLWPHQSIRSWRA